jgi:hypothetical protein
MHETSGSFPVHRVDHAQPIETAPPQHRPPACPGGPFTITTGPALEALLSHLAAEDSWCWASVALTSGSYVLSTSHTLRQMGLSLHAHTDPATSGVELKGETSGPILVLEGAQAFVEAKDVRFTVGDPWGLSSRGYCHRHMDLAMMFPTSRRSKSASLGPPATVK